MSDRYKLREQWAAERLTLWLEYCDCRDAWGDL